MIECKPSEGMPGLYNAVLRHWQRVTNNEENLTILDLGCGDCQFIVEIIGERGMHNTGVRYGIDAIADRVRPGYDLRRLDSYIVGNAIDYIYKFKANSFDVIFLFDFLEHLDKQDGWDLISEMKRVAHYGIVMEGPEGVCIRPGPEYLGHVSHWTAEEIADRGFDVEVFDMFHGDCSAMVASYKKDR